MASWVEDMVQALKNLGGKAHQEDIFKEVVRIRKEPDPLKVKQIFLTKLWRHSSSSMDFKDDVYFRSYGLGVWGLRTDVWKIRFSRERQEASTDKENNETAGWIADIHQALQNLGGRAHQKRIIEEVALIRKDSLQNRVQLQVLNAFQVLTSNSSSDYQLEYIGNGEWLSKAQKSTSQSVVEEKQETDVKDQTQLHEKTAEVLSGAEGKVVESKPDNRISLKNIPATNRYEKRPVTNTSLSMEKTDARNKTLANEIHLEQGIRENSTIPYDFKPQESADEIRNCLDTIKQYREYNNPSSPSWRGYVEEIFHILGFITEKMDSRLMELKVMGGGRRSVAMVAIFTPGEDKEEIVAGLTWMSYLFYAASYHQTPWVILTDGLEIKIYEIHENQINIALDWLELDETILYDWHKAFHKLYRMFAFMRGSNSIESPPGS